MRLFCWMLSVVLLGCGTAEKSAQQTPISDAGVDSAAPEPDPDTEDTAGPMDPCDAEPEVTWNSWAQGFFRGYCTSCHSRTVPDRWGAPEGLDFDTEADVVSRAAQIRSAVLESDRMPVGGGVIAADLELLEVYLDCGL